MFHSVRQPRRTVWSMLAVLALLLLPGRPVSAQFIDKHFAPVPTVPEPGTYPEPVQQAIEEGYRQLELVTSPSDDVHLEAAGKAFEAALDADSRSIHALNGLGICQLSKDEGWLVLVESVKKLLNRDHITLAVRAFEKALSIDPTFSAARYNLALAHRQTRSRDSYRRASAELDRLVQDVSDFPGAAFLLAITYRDLGDLEGMARTLESIPTGPAFPLAEQQLMLAYELINSGQPEEGAAAYWKGVDAIFTEREASIYWFDIRPIVEEEADRQFRSLDVETSKAYLRDFWQRLADLSFVTPDERLAEHYRRLDYVYRNYRLELPERRHYSAVAAYAPLWQTGFDDRGVIYLRHGPPDDTATYSGPEVDQNVSWRYDRPGNDPLIFHFVSDEDIGDFKLIRRLSDAIIATNASLKGQRLLDPNAATGLTLRGAGGADADDVRILASQREALKELYRSRGSIDPDYDRAAMDLDPQILETEEAHLARSIEIGTLSQSYEPQRSEEPLSFPVYPVPFKGAEGGPVVNLYYAVPTTGIEMLPTRAGGTQVDYRYQIRLNPTEDPDAVVRRAEDEVHISTSKEIPRGPGIMLPGVKQIAVDPGKYQYGMKLTDMNSGSFGILTGGVTVEDFSNSGLGLSGIVLASKIEPATDPTNPFVRWEQLKVLPLPSRIFRRDQAVFVYYEIYGLTPAPESRVRYRTTYTLDAKERDRNVVARFFSAVGELLSGDSKRGSLSYSFDREAAPSDPLLEYISLDVSGSEVGEYTLSVEIENLASGETRRQATQLTLVD